MYNTIIQYYNTMYITIFVYIKYFSQRLFVSVHGNYNIYVNDFKCPDLVSKIKFIESAVKFCNPSFYNKDYHCHNDQG